MEMKQHIGMCDGDNDGNNDDEKWYGALHTA